MQKTVGIWTNYGPVGSKGIERWLVEGGYRVAFQLTDVVDVSAYCRSCDLLVVALVGDFSFILESMAKALGPVRDAVPPPAVLLMADNMLDKHRVGKLERLGVRGLLPMTTVGSKFIECVGVLADGGRCIDPSVIRASSADDDLFARVASLVSREREVWRLIALGKITREVAVALGVKYKTADTHRSNLMAKLDVHDVAHVISAALRAGIITVEELMNLTR